VKLATDMSEAEYQAARAAMVRQSREAPAVVRVKAEPTAAPKDRIDAELKSLATGAGLIDMDGLKLADLSKVKINEAGEVEGAAEVMDALKKAKPYLFGGASTSSSHRPPPPPGKQTKHVMDMTAEEYATARAEMIRACTPSRY